MASKIDNLKTAISAIDAKIARLQYRRTEIGDQLVAEFKKAHPEYREPQADSSAGESTARSFADPFLQQVNDEVTSKM